VVSKWKPESTAGSVLATDHCLLLTPTSGIKLAYHGQTSYAQPMCGIAGFIEKSWSDQEANARLRAVLGLIAHRGPDGEGMHVAPGIAIGMRRLPSSISRAATNPFGTKTRPSRRLQWRDLQLRGAPRGTGKRGHRFRHSQRHGGARAPLEEEGAKLVQRLRGIVRLCHPRRAQAHAFLARDHFGQKAALLPWRGRALRFRLRAEVPAGPALRAARSGPLGRARLATWLSLRRRARISGDSKTARGQPSHHSPLIRPPSRSRFATGASRSSSRQSSRSLTLRVECIDGAFSESIRLHFRATCRSASC